MATDAERKEQALTEYRSKLQKHKEIDTKVRALRETVKELKKDYDKTEDDLKALQVGTLLRTQEFREHPTQHSGRVSRAVQVLHVVFMHVQRT